MAVEENARGELVLRAGGGGPTATVDARTTERLRPHQKRGVAFLYSRLAARRPTAAAAHADHMGLGKTLQTLTLVRALVRGGGGLHGGGGGRVQRVLLLAPASLTSNWVAEVDKWFGRHSLPLVHLGSDGRKPEHAVDDFLSGRKPLLISSYQRAIQPKVLEKLGRATVGLMVCDEGHVLKNVATKLYQRLFSLRCERRLVLTGTPLE